MIYGVILAGGVGSRMGNREKPKQYINIGDKPIIVHTIEKFCLCSEFEEILILCPKDWIEYTKGLVKKYVSETEKIKVIEGGETRNETIMNAIAYIEREGKLDEDTLIVTHDASGNVRHWSLSAVLPMRTTSESLRNSSIRNGAAKNSATESTPRKTAVTLTQKRNARLTRS